jgi:hypothetical protein
LEIAAIDLVFYRIYCNRRRNQSLGCKTRFLREMTQESQSGSSNDKKAEQRIAFGQRLAILPTDLMI